MRFFRHLPKSALWSQFLLGIVAIFALPTPPAMAESETENVINQYVLRLTDLSTAKVEQEPHYFIQQEQQPLAVCQQQAVEFCEFFANGYSFDFSLFPPIRAGPAV